MLSSPFTCPESEKAPEEDLKDKNVTESDLSEGIVQKLVFLLKKFLLSIADPANNSYVDATNTKRNPFLFRSFIDRFKTFADVTSAMKDAGLGRCHLILGIDFTASNEWQGRSTHKGRPLHNLVSTKVQNPYQHVITVLQHTLKDFVDLQDSVPLGGVNEYSKKIMSGIPAFGFGDTETRDHSTFSLRPDGFPCSSFEEVLQHYKDCASLKVLSGPTSYAPIIHKTIEIVEQTNQYHILVIIADGQFVNKGPTTQAIVAASYYPLSIIVVGVGDGPWDTMHQFDDWLPQRQFDNFQFVEYEKIVKSTNSKNVEALLALHMLMEVPDQYKMVHKLGYVGSEKKTNKKFKL